MMGIFSSIGDNFQLMILLILLSKKPKRSSKIDPKLQVKSKLINNLQRGRLKGQQNNGMMSNNYERNLMFLFLMKILGKVHFLRKEVRILLTFMKLIVQRVYNLIRSGR
jgi:small-conductance mechanosensitive channel